MNDMKMQLEQRLQELATEFDTGQAKLNDLEGQVSTLRDTLLRISGAIQVLKEELGKSSGRTTTEPNKKLEQVV